MFEARCTWRGIGMSASADGGLQAVAVRAAARMVGVKLYNRLGKIIDKGF